MSSQSPGVARMPPSLPPAGGPGAAVVSTSVVPQTAAALAPVPHMASTLDGAPHFPSTSGSIWNRVEFHPESIDGPAAVFAAPFRSEPAGPPLAIAAPSFGAPALVSDGHELLGPIVSLNGGVAGLPLHPRHSLGSEGAPRPAHMCAGQRAPSIPFQLLARRALNPHILIGLRLSLAHISRGIEMLSSKCMHAGSTAASAPVPQSAQQGACGAPRDSTRQSAGGSIEPESVGDAGNVPARGSNLCEPEEPAFLMSHAPHLSQHLPVPKQKTSIVAQLEKELQRLPEALGAALPWPPCITATGRFCALCRMHSFSPGRGDLQWQGTSVEMLTVPSCALLPRLVPQAHSSTGTASMPMWVPLLCVACS